LKNIYKNENFYRQNFLKCFKLPEIESSYRSYQYHKQRFFVIVAMLLTLILEIFDFTYLSTLSTYYEQSEMGYYFLINMFLWMWAIQYVALKRAGKIFTRIVIFMPSLYFYLIMFNKEEC